MTTRQKELPSGWKWVKLGDVCLQTGTVNPKDKANEEFNYVDISAVDRSAKRILDPSRLLGKDAPSRARKLIRESDVLVSGTRPNLNAVALVPRELSGSVCSTGFSVLRTNEKLMSEYLFAFVRTPQFVSNLTSLTTGQLYPAVSDKQIKSQFIPLPPLEEQKIVAKRLVHGQHIMKTNAESDTKIEELKSSLLQRAFRGEF